MAQGSLVTSSCRVTHLIEHQKQRNQICPNYSIIFISFTQDCRKHRYRLPKYKAVPPPYQSIFKKFIR